MTDFAVTGYLFDCDGVLADSLESAAVAWDAWSAIYAPHYNFRLEHVQGRRAGDTVALLVTPEIRVVAERALEQLEIDGVGATLEIPGAGALVRSLPDGIWAVCTSGIRELATRRLASAGIPEPRVLITAEDVSRGKPDPEPYLKGAAALGLAPSDCVVFEDAPAGVQAALAAGVAVIIGVGAEALGHGATCVVPDLTAVTYVDGVLRIDDAARLDLSLPAAS